MTPVAGFERTSDGALLISDGVSSLVRSGIAESVPRHALINLGVTLASGTLRLAALPVLGGKSISALAFVSGGAAAVGLTNAWACLVRASDLAVVAKTTDRGAMAWAANAAESFTFAAPFIVPSTALYYAGLVVVGATPPASAGGGQTAANALLPVLAGNSTAGLTDPASLGATAAALTAANLIYARAS